jgi:hypothetical protein
MDLGQIAMLRKGGFSGPILMPASRDLNAGSNWRKLAVLLLAVAAVGLPINDAVAYAPLVLLAVIIFTGEVRAGKGAWLAAVAIVVVSVAGQWLLAPPRFDEGHNVFLPGGPSHALEQGLPAEVYRHLADEFDKQYPVAKRCGPAVAGAGSMAGSLIGFTPFRPMGYSTNPICRVR